MKRAIVQLELERSGNFEHYDRGVDHQKHPWNEPEHVRADSIVRCPVLGENLKSRFGMFNIRLC